SSFSSPRFNLIALLSSGDRYALPSFNELNSSFAVSSMIVISITESATEKKEKALVEKKKSIESRKLIFTRAKQYAEEYEAQAGKQARPEKFEIPAKIKLTLQPWTSSLRGGHQEGIRDGPCPVVQPKKAEDYRNSLQQEAQAKAQALHFEDELARKRMPVTARDMHSRYIPQQDYFSEGLYTFDIGQNDLVIVSIPTILLEFENGLKKLYDQGARKFWIHNTGPLGCLPQNIALFGKDPSQLDELHCVAKHNRAAKLFNLQLHALCTKLRAEFDGASITYVDIHTIKYSLIANYSRY
ncbi:hypothetical protein ACJX0J_013029, partial [Zea mays]